MAKVKITGHASGTGVLTVTAPNTSTDRTITLPDSTGTILDENSSLPAANLTGTVATARLGTGTADSTTFLRGDQSYAEAGGGAWTFISETVASTSATISITSGFSSTYDMYMVVITNIDPVTTDSELHMLTSTDGGSSYHTSGYRYSLHCFGVGSADDSQQYTSASELAILKGTGSNESLQSGNRGGHCFVYIGNPSDASEKTHIHWNGGFHTAGNEQMTVNGSGCYDAAAEDLDAVRFQMESGNISTGNFALYGLKNS